MKNTASLPQTGFLRLPQVLTFIPVSKTTLYEKIRAGSFPAPIKLGPRTSAWRCEDVREYIEKAAA